MGSSARSSRYRANPVTMKHYMRSKGPSRSREPDIGVFFSLLGCASFSFTAVAMVY